LLTKEKHRALAERNNWSLEFSQGFVDGEAHRQRAKSPSPYVLVGFDQYCLGFRSGYFERRSSPVSPLSAPLMRAA
jgi:hypothetical protein